MIPTSQPINVVPARFGRTEERPLAHEPAVDHPTATTTTTATNPALPKVTKSQPTLSVSKKPRPPATASMKKSPPSPTVKTTTTTTTKSSAKTLSSPAKKKSQIDAAALAVLERANAARKKYADVNSTQVVLPAAAPRQAKVASKTNDNTTNGDNKDTTTTKVISPSVTKEALATTATLASSSSSKLDTKTSAVKSVASDRKPPAVKTATTKTTTGSSGKSLKPKPKPKPSRAAKASAAAASAQADALAKVRANNAVNRGTTAAAAGAATKPGAVAVNTKPPKATVSKKKTVQRLETDVLSKARSRPGTVSGGRNMAHHLSDKKGGDTQVSSIVSGTSTAPNGNHHSMRLETMSVASEDSTIITTMMVPRTKQGSLRSSAKGNDKEKHGLRMAPPEAEDDEEDEIEFECEEDDEDDDDDNDDEDDDEDKLYVGMEVGGSPQRGSFSGDVSVLTQDTSSVAPYGGSSLSMISTQESVPVAAEIALPTLTEEESSQRVKRMVAEELERERQQQVFVNAIPEGDEEKEEKGSSLHRSWKVFFIGGIIGILLCIVIVVPLAVKIPQGKNNNNGGSNNNNDATTPPGSGGGGENPASTIAPTMAPTVSIESLTASTKLNLILEVILPLYDNLFGVTDDPQLLENKLLTPDTPQFEALTWMVYEDDFVQLDAEGSLRTPILEVEQRYALAVLYFSTNGPFWDRRYDFLSTKPVCQWGIGGQNNGVACAVSFETVSALFLGDNSLSGSLPRELALLTNLKDLNFQHNYFAGTTIPSEYGTFREMESLSFWGCQLSGTIPPEFELLTSLESLNLEDNELSGPLPRELFRLSNTLTELTVRSNLLTSTIPTEYGFLSNLDILDLGYNDIYGPLPSQFSLLSALRFLFLDNNSLSGTPPPEMGDLGELRFFWLQYNLGLTGTLPLEWSNMVSMEDLQLVGTSLTGDLDFLACEPHINRMTAPCLEDMTTCTCCTNVCR